MVRADALMAGTITGVNGNQVTIQTGQGATLTLTIGSDADVRTTTLGSVSDLATGDRVLLTGGGGASSSGTAVTRQILVLRGAGAGAPARVVPRRRRRRRADPPAGVTGRRSSDPGGTVRA